MENGAHTLCGLALARAGGDRLSPLATATLVVAANLPDIDVVGMPFGGRPYYLCHHRGLTHALLGLAVESIVLAGIVYGAGRALRKADAEPLRFRGLWLAAAIGLLSHLLLDSLNTYGVRPFLPFSDARFYGDMAFIVDPWLWLGFGAAATLGAPPQPPDPGPGDRRRELLARVGWWAAAWAGFGLLLNNLDRVPAGVPLLWGPVMFALVLARHRGWPGAARRQRAAWIALGAVGLYLALLCGLQRTADRRAREAIAQARGVEVDVSTTHPSPAIPWRFWSLVASRDAVYQARLDLFQEPELSSDVLPRHLEDPRLARAEGTAELHAWRCFARIPFVGIAPATSAGAGKPARPPRLILGDARYTPRPEESWSNLAVPLAPEPTPPR